MEGQRVAELEETVAGLQDQFKYIMDALNQLNQHASATPPTPSPVTHSDRKSG